MSTHDSKDQEQDTAPEKTGPGTTEDPNQASRTGFTKKAPVQPDVTPDPEAEPDDPKTGPGSTSDPNQANRT